MRSNRSYKGFPFQLNQDDINYVTSTDLYRTYQYLKMFLKKTIDKKSVKKTVLSTLKDVFVLNFNKKGLAQGATNGDPALFIEKRYLNSQKLRDQIKILTNLGYSEEEVQLRLQLDQFEFTFPKYSNKEKMDRKENQRDILNEFKNLQQCMVQRNCEIQEKQEEQDDGDDEDHRMI